jgi:hypothetical protein
MTAALIAKLIAGSAPCNGREKEYFVSRIQFVIPMRHRAIDCNLAALGTVQETMSRGKLVEQIPGGFRGRLDMLLRKPRTFAKHGEVSGIDFNHDRPR